MPRTERTIERRRLINCCLLERTPPLCLEALLDRRAASRELGEAQLGVVQLLGTCDGFATGRVEGGTPMSEAAEAMGLPYRELGPFNRISPPLPTPELVGAAFGIEPGQRSPVLDTPQGLYVLEVLQHTPADSAAFRSQLDELRAAGIQVAKQERVRSYMDALVKNAEIEDRRDEVYRTQNQQQQTLQQPLAL